MYCGQCGKKVMDNMLFCPFCGSPIVIPDQDDEMGREQIPKETVVPPVENAEITDDSEVVSEAPVEEFIPLSFEYGEDRNDKDEKQIYSFEPKREPETAPVIEDVPPEPEAAAPESRPPQNAARKRSGSTYIPVKEVDVDDLFMNESEESYDSDDYDDYDAYDQDDSEDFEDFDFEEQEEGGFFRRHVRGIVGLILTLVVILIVVLWACTEGGQMKLAPMNLAWKPQPYAELGYEAYQQGSFERAAGYYEKAYARDSANYEYAHSAMVAYYDAESIDKAAEMLKKCIEMDPDNIEPYQEMLILYPDAASRPWEVSELLRMGYQRTGNEALNTEG